MEYKKLEEEGRFSTTDYRVIERCDNVALVHQYYDDFNIHVGYQVHIIQKKKPTEINGKTYPAKESLASASMFGNQGWQYSNNEYEEACEKFNSLCREMREGENE